MKNVNRAFKLQTSQSAIQIHFKIKWIQYHKVVEHGRINIIISIAHRFLAVCPYIDFRKSHPRPVRLDVFDRQSPQTRPSASIGITPGYDLRLWLNDPWTRSRVLFISVQTRTCVSDRILHMGNSISSNSRRKIYVREFELMGFIKEGDILKVPDRYFGISKSIKVHSNTQHASDNTTKSHYFGRALYY